jgi:archaellum component FlaC
MTTIEELERRVTALEVAQKETAKTQTWMASTLGRIASVQDQHTVAIGELKSDIKRLDAKVERVEADVSGLKADLVGLREELPGMLAEAVREGMRRQ